MAVKRVSIRLEFMYSASPTILYKFLTTPACLVRWFCDKVDINQNVFIFTWDDTEQQATLVEDIEDEILRFEWDDAPGPNEYLEFRISETDVTGGTILTITDFCDANEVNDIKKLWESQIRQMKLEMGSA